MKKTCEECVFWEGLSDGMVGICRRRSPQPATPVVNAEDGDNNLCYAYASWPKTSPDDWCGEFKQIENH